MNRYAIFYQGTLPGAQDGMTGTATVTPHAHGRLVCRVLAPRGQALTMPRVPTHREPQRSGTGIGSAHNKVRDSVSPSRLVCTPGRSELLPSFTPRVRPSEEAGSLSPSRLVCAPEEVSSFSPSRLVCELPALVGAAGLPGGDLFLRHLAHLALQRIKRLVHRHRRRRR